MTDPQGDQRAFGRRDADTKVVADLRKAIGDTTKGVADLRRDLAERDRRLADDLAQHRDAVLGALAGIRREQDQTNDHLATLNGRMGRSETRLDGHDGRAQALAHELQEIDDKITFAKGVLAPILVAWHLSQNKLLTGAILVGVGVLTGAQIGGVLAALAAILGLEHHP